MATTLSYDAITITLPDDLLWRDEWDWQPVAQRRAYTIAGALVLESAARQAGRPITLEPADDDSAWITRATLAQLRTAAALPGQQLTLAWRGASYTVVFRHDESSGAVTAQPVVHYGNNDAADWYRTTLRLLEV